MNYFRYLKKKVHQFCECVVCACVYTSRKGIPHVLIIREPMMYKLTLTITNIFLNSSMSIYPLNEIKLLPLCKN